MVLQNRRWSHAQSGICDLQLGQQVQGGGQEDLEEEARQGEEKVCYKDAFETNHWFTDHVGGNLPIVGTEDEAISVDSYHTKWRWRKRRHNRRLEIARLALNMFLLRLY